MVQYFIVPEIIVIVHNIRSTHNVGSIFRSAEGFGVKKIICSGYTPYPKLAADSRLPHIADKLNLQIHKTALDAEKLVPFEYQPELDLLTIKNQGYTLVGLEQDQRAIKLADYQPAAKIALVLGEEVAGITAELREQCDTLLEIPMYGQKESFNVSVAAGIALYRLTSAG